MKLAHKTIQSHIDFLIAGNYDWVDVDYRGSQWELTCEQYPEDNTANFWFSNGRKCFVIDTDPVFIHEQLHSAAVKGIHLVEEAA